jgi:hypothetical protein
MPLLSQEEEKK